MTLDKSVACRVCFLLSLSCEYPSNEILRLIASRSDELARLLRLCLNPNWAESVALVSRLDDPLEQDSEVL